MSQIFGSYLQHNCAGHRRHIATDVGTLIRLRKQIYKKNNESPTPISAPVLQQCVNSRYEEMSVNLFILACYPLPYVFGVCLLGCRFPVEVSTRREFRQTCSVGIVICMVVCGLPVIDDIKS